MDDIEPSPSFASVVEGILSHGSDPAPLSSNTSPRFSYGEPADYSDVMGRGERQAYDGVRSSAAVTGVPEETLDAEHALELELLGLDPVSATSLPDDIKRQIDERARLLAQATTAAAQATPNALEGRKTRLTSPKGNAAAPAFAQAAASASAAGLSDSFLFEALPARDRELLTARIPPPPPSHRPAYTVVSVTAGRAAAEKEWERESQLGSPSRPPRGSASSLVTAAPAALQSSGSNAGSVPGQLNAPPSAYNSRRSTGSGLSADPSPAATLTAAAAATAAGSLQASILGLLQGTPGGNPGPTTTARAPAPAKAPAPLDRPTLYTPNNEARTATTATTMAYPAAQTARKQATGGGAASSMGSGARAGGPRSSLSRPPAPRAVSPGRQLGYSAAENSDSWLFTEQDTYDRQTRWRKRLEEEWARKRDESRSNEGKECTFKPHINPNSKKLVAEGMRYPEEKWIRTAAAAYTPRPPSPGPTPRLPPRSPTQSPPRRPSPGPPEFHLRGGRSASGAHTARASIEPVNKTDMSGFSEAESFHNVARALEDFVPEGADTTTVACLRLYAQALQKGEREEQKQALVTNQVRDSFQSEFSEIMQATRPKRAQITSRWRQTPRSTSPPPESYSFRPDTSTSRKSYRMLKKVDAAVLTIKESAMRIDEPGVSAEFAQILGDLTKDPMKSARKITRALEGASKRTGHDRPQEITEAYQRAFSSYAAAVVGGTPGPHAQGRAASPGPSSPGPGKKRSGSGANLQGFPLDDLSETLRSTMALLSPRHSNSGDENDGGKVDFNAFLDRQARFQAYREQKRQLREEEIYSRAPPGVLPASRRILERSARNRMSVGGPDGYESEATPRTRVTFAPGQDSARDSSASDLRSRPIPETETSYGATSSRARASSVLRSARDLSPGPGRESLNLVPGYENCTFKPTISRKSAKLPSRPLVDLAYNDRRKIETKVEMLRERIREREDQELVFKPRTTQAIPRNVISTDQVSGRLGLTRDPDGYMNWAMQKLEDFETWRAQELEKRLIKEMEECTHQPTTVAPPNFILRLARSRAVRLADGVDEPTVHESASWRT